MISHGLMLVAILVMPLTLLLHLLFAAVVLCSWFWSMRVWRGHCPPVFSVRDEVWYLGGRDSEQAAALAACHYASDWLVVFRLRLLCGGSETILIARDSLEPEGYRRLRASLGLAQTETPVNCPPQ